MARTDVVVAGLGVAGSATALALARRGVDVVALDPNAPPHELGSSHGQTRITRRSVAEGDAFVPLVARSHECWRELEGAERGSLFVECGLLVLGDAGGGVHHGRRDFKDATVQLAERHGIPHELLDRDEVESRFGAIHAPRGTAYLEPDAGYLRAEACVAALQRAAAERGARLRLRDAVLGWERRGSGLEVHTSAGVVEADRLVLCVGPWLPSVAPSLARVVSVQRQAAHWFEVDPAGAPALAALPAYLWFHGPAPDDWFYGFPLDGGAGGGLKVATETYGAATDPDRVDRRVAPDEAAAVYAAHVAGRLRGSGPRAVRSSVCLYTVTEDFGFVLDELDGEPGVLVVSACSGHGFKHAPAVGECAAALALGEDPPFDCGEFGLARFA